MDYKNKILLVSPLPPPFGGIGSWSLNVKEYFDKIENGINFKHFDSNKSIRLNRITEKSFLRRIISGFLNLIFQVYSILLIKKDFKPNVIHFVSSGGFGLIRDLILILLFRYKTKTILHFHFGRIPEMKFKNNLEWKLLLLVVRLSNICIVIDSKSYNILVMEGFNNLKCLPNPIKIDLESFVLNKYEENTILFVGHITKNKGVYELAEAFLKLETKSKLLLIGPYEFNTKLDLLNILREKVNDVVFLGEMNKVEVLKAMRKAKIFVLPSYTEGFPNVILEAMSCSSAIIATNVGAIPDMLDNEAGICINPKSSIELLEAFNLLMLNDNIYSKIKQNAFNIVKDKYSIELVLKDLTQIWKS